MKHCSEFDEQLQALRAMGSHDLEARLQASLHLQAQCHKAGCGTHYVHAVLVEALTYIQQGLFEKSLQRLYAVLPLAEETQDDRALINTKKLAAESLFQIGNFTDAVELFFEVLPLAERNSDQRLAASINLSLGRAYLVLNNPTDGLKYLKLALKQFEAADYAEGKHGAQINIGVALIEVKEFDAARAILEAAIASLRTNNVPHQLANALGLLGTVHTAGRQFAAANSVLSDALNLALELGDRYNECDLLCHLANMHLAAEAPQQALKHCQDALAIAENSGYKQLVCAACLLLADIYHALDNPSEALEQFKQYHYLERELLNSDAQNISNSMRLRFEGERAARDAEIQRLRNVELVELNTKLVESNTELSSTNAKLNTMNAEKSLFMHTLKHDLLNPLKHVIFYAEELDDGFDHFSNAQMLQYIRSVKQQSSDLHTMVETLLSVSLIELGEFTIEFASVDITDCIHNRLEIWGPAAGKKNIELKVTTPAMPVRLKAQRTHLLQIIDNLLSNAVKFSAFGGVIAVQLEVKQTTAVLAVNDSGPGLSAEDQKQLFQLFKRLGPVPTAGEKSHGIGLAFVQRVTAAMHGRVWYEPAAGQGARFCVELPLAAD